jgi:hypothetical protein
MSHRDSALGKSGCSDVCLKEQAGGRNKKRLRNPQAPKTDGALIDAETEIAPPRSAVHIHEG